MIFDSLYFLGPMDLGDCFVHNGIVNYYADRCQQLHVPVQPKYYDTISCLYSEHPNIITVPMEVDQEEAYINCYKISRIINDWEMVFRDVNGYRTAILWDEQIYTHFELPFSMRYSNFRLPKYIPEQENLYNRLYQNRPYILIHRSTGQHPDGLPIDVEKFRTDSGLSPEVDVIEVVPSITSNMLNYVRLIENAEEIHCVNSSFFCLVDSIFHRTRAKLFFHDIRASSIMRVNSEWNRRCWNIVYYPNKF
jgi:hypothetical protein